jgi:localization factor PodJL
MRIAASEADLGPVRPAATTPSNKSSFIAAARRAAQAAGQDPKSRQARPESFRKNGSEKTSPKAKIGTRVRSMFLAASIISIIVGSIQFASNIFDFEIFNTNETKVAAPSPETDTANGDIAAEAPESETPATLADGQPALPDAPALGTADTDTTASLLAPPTLPSLTPALPPPLATAAPAQPPLNLNEIGQGSLPILNPPALNAPFLGTAPGPKADITGSIPRAPAAPATRQSAPAAQPSADGLPAAIGGPRLRNAALAGDPAAAYEVAMRFVEGRGVPANLEEAARWYERAARKGLAPAQFRYASMLEKGQGVKKNLSAAHKLYVAAAAKGHAKAMHNLAVLYAEGAEGAPDYANAAQWFRKAAEHGVADSQYNLGVLTTRGLGTEKNIAESYKWFALAAAQGDRDAGRKRDEVAALLDAQTLGAAQQATKSFTVQAQPAEAIFVPEPLGGWDSTTPPPNEKPRAAGPLSINPVNSGKL